MKFSRKKKKKIIEIYNVAFIKPNVASTLGILEPNLAISFTDD